LQVENVDYEKRRISLSVTSINAEEAAARAEGARLAAMVVVGAELAGTVESLKDFGAFIRLPDNRSGLLHVSRMGLADGPARLRQMHGQFGVGKEVKVLVNAIDGDRVSLSIPGVKEQGNEVDEEEAAYNEYRAAQPKADGPLGSMASVFGALDKLKLD
jgi:small subunit ribosomal protein S1